MLPLIVADLSLFVTTYHHKRLIRGEFISTKEAAIIHTVIDRDKPATF